MLLKTVLAIFLLVPSSYSQSGSKSWFKVLEVKGTASKQTDLFESAIATQSEGADESYVHKSGTFYLNISASTAYTIVVEDWR